jgi:predicted DNA repair protein MutK
VQGVHIIEDEKVESAIKTDFVLSAEIMAITLATIPATSFILQALILAVVGIGITALVYGAVALIVKADDAGVALALNDAPASALLRRRPADDQPSRADRLLRPFTRGLGRALVSAMPILLRALSLVGMAAMLWVGGGIILHGLEGYGLDAPAHAVHAAASAMSDALSMLADFVSWIVAAALSGLLGLLLGAAAIPAVQYLLVPAIRFGRRILSARRSA